MKPILSVAFLCLFHLIWSQQQKMLPKIQNPEAYNLGLYGIYPVDHSTGVPKIDIPLYTIKSGSLSFPISASYHASGIKVNQDASNIGLGWVLNAGGMVFRNVRDMPDDYSNVGFLHSGNSIPVFNDIYDEQTEGTGNAVGTVGNNDLLKSYYGTRSPMGGSSSSHKDNYPDIFNITTNLGLTGSFVLNNDRKFVSTEFNPQNLNVDLFKNSIIVNDEKGNTYRFGKSSTNNEAYETTSNSVSFDYASGYYNGLRFPDHVKSWLLTEVISADKADTIRIKYDRIAGIGKTFFQSESRSTATSFILGAKLDSDSKNYLSQTSDIQTIKSISFKDGSIEFDLKSDRQDEASPRINGISVYDKNKKLLRKILFDHNYFSRYNAENDPNINTQLLKSLKLDKIKFYDKNNSFDGEYSFEYDSTLLPSRESVRSIDFWGYYNGKDNSSLIPDELVNKVYSPKTLSNKKRESNFDFMKAASLTKITYPTKGYSLYEYEPNYYIEEIGGKNFIKQDKRISAVAMSNTSGCPEGISFNGVGPKTTLEYDVTEDVADGIANVSLYFSDYKYNYGPMLGKIYVDGWEISEQHTPDNMTNYKTFDKKLAIGYRSKIKIELDTRDAKGPSKYSPCSSPFIQASVSYNYNVEVNTPQEIIAKQAGGLRVKNITNYDSSNLILSKKHYEYGSKQVGNNNIGVGKLIVNPFEVETYYKRLSPYFRTTCSLEPEETIHISSSPMLELELNNGNPVYYDKVTEYTESNDQQKSNNGKTEYYYSRKGINVIPSADHFRTYPTFIYPVWKDSNLIKTISYKKENANYFPIKKDEYRYDKAIEHRIRTLNIFEQDIEPIGVICSQGSIVGYQGVNPNRFRYFNDYTSIGKKVLTEKYSTDYTYTANKKDSLVTTTKYEYNNPVHFQLTKENTILPGLNKQETTYQYAHEKGNQYLIDKNMIGIPLQTTVTQKQNDNDPGKTISKSEILYPTSQADANAKTAGLALPVSVLGFDLQNPNDAAKAQTELTYDLYDNKGNILQYSVKGKPVTVIWGYNQTQPIAKIEGAAYNQISAYVSAIIAASDADNTQGTDQSEQALIEALDLFRNHPALSAYQITTYTYNPLIGVTSITPPSGVREIYKYDSANRLESVKDVNGNLLKEYQYRYKN
ncbi:hypothetical protein [Elizabethkingia anophelis]|uniref:hypothetical protein n=1 Tax=Elizabethkingia anophelis TaxID=1117645 RepID=UPI0022264F89|nr:hypothetical protein [Elizabethkingia anophelis]MCW2464383.1 hypothetical protein [Elizabethkingia anophelis]MCW2468066.1 hypothetical protein [Elizabethkingia anophelis]MCW2471750.1 hypothetical protein [Elizabethkingia anophelis]HBI9692940.1 hypothetical protein [Elizabethkingia anophelis]HBI9696960.1 hypothetical protein [Elizabethkingia anophelis]